MALFSKCNVFHTILSYIYHNFYVVVSQIVLFCAVCGVSVLFSYYFTIFVCTRHVFSAKLVQNKLNMCIFHCLTKKLTDSVIVEGYLHFVFCKVLQIPC